MLSAFVGDESMSDQLRRNSGEWGALRTCRKRYCEYGNKRVLERTLNYLLSSRH